MRYLLSFVTIVAQAHSLQAIAFANIAMDKLLSAAGMAWGVLVQQAI